MDIQFVDPSEVPLPPDEVRIRRLEARPYEDSRRIAVRVLLTPFQERPSLVLAVLDGEDQIWAEANVVETVDHQLELTMHLRGPFESGIGRLRVEVGYLEGQPVDVQETEFRLS